MNDCVIEIKAVEWNGDLKDFQTVKNLIQSCVVGLQCIHCTILNDAIRAAYHAGTNA